MLKIKLFYRNLAGLLVCTTVVMTPVSSLAKGIKYYDKNIYTPKPYEMALDEYDWGHKEDLEFLEDKEGVLDLYEAIKDAYENTPKDLLPEVYLVIKTLDKDLDIQKIKAIATHGVDSYFKDDVIVTVAQGESVSKEDIDKSFVYIKEYISTKVDTFNLTDNEREQLESVVYLTILEKEFDLSALNDLVDVLHMVIKDTESNVFNIDFCQIDTSEKESLTFTDFIENKENYLYKAKDNTLGVYYKDELIPVSLLDKIIEVSGNNELLKYSSENTNTLQNVLSVEAKDTFFLEGLYKTVLGRKTIVNVLGTLNVTEENINAVNYRNQIDKVINIAKSKVGYPYSQASRSTLKAFDCSSLVWYCYNEIGINLGGKWSNTDMQLKFAETNDLVVDKKDLKAGDLIYYYRGKAGHHKGVGHVGMYIGDGQMIDARSGKYGVVQRKVDHKKVIAYVRPLNIVK